MIQAIEAIGVPSLTPSVAVGVAPEAVSGAFGTVFDGAMSRIDSDVTAAEQALQSLASGQPVELHDVMITIEKARISVQTLLQVRNRVLEAYQEVTRMQV